jgi:hypothetical protein
VSPGPFEITPDQITRLGPRFTTFVNKLLEVERSTQGLDGPQLSINVNENASDGGVDAALRGSAGTFWVPAGDTAFQFKRSSQSAAKCADELAEAPAAKAMLQAGGSYVIALGGDTVPDTGVQERHAAIVAKAVELQLIDADQAGRIRVYDANLIARWASQHPALAVDPILQGVQLGAIDFERWRGSRVHQLAYSPDTTRTQQIAELRDRLASTQPVDIRLQGDSGIGKTRLALEALDDPRFRSQVAYIDDASQTGGGLIESLIDQGRHAIVVVDECPAERHIKLTAKLPTNPGVKLITIGDVGTSRSSGPVVGVEALADDAMGTLLTTSFPALSSEARRFVRDHSHGAPAWAIWLANAVERSPDAQAADMIARNDIEQFITTFLPEGRAFFLAAVLALFERVGWDRDLRIQMELLASFADATPTDLDNTLRDLTSHNLIRTQGRYRAVDPLPVAIYLAAEGWREFGARIIDELLPTLSDDMAIALFRRLAQLGRFEPARAVLPRLLAASGPFGNLQSIDANQLGALLTQFAIVMPDEVTTHLTLLIDEASGEELAELRDSRRDLVWTLEKLAWHTWTFERAADALLKLALAENETYANNATGTWIDLFGALLPGTAATSAQRAVYFERVAADPRSEVRALAIRATANGLGSHESITVSGEVQGGVLVEPRGAPATWAELGEYRRVLLRTLERLRADVEPTVADAATKALLGAIHPLIDDQFVGDELAGILSSFTGDALQQLRVDLEHLLSLHARHANEDRHILQALQELRRRLPSPDYQDELRVLLQMQRWDLGDEELQDRITETVRALGPEDRVDLVDLLQSDVPAAWELGRALAVSESESDELLSRLTGHFTANPNALIGYLRGLVDAGDESVFERFLDSTYGAGLELRDRLVLAVRGPVTAASRRRILDGTAALPVRDAAAAMFGWGRNLSSDDIAGLVDDWIARTETQDDYNAAVDWLNLNLPDGAMAPELLDPMFRLLRGRAVYHDIGRQGWGWARLALRVVDDHALELLVLLLDLIEGAELMIHSGDEDAAILRRCLERQPLEGWAELGARLESQEAWRLSMQLRGWVQFSVPIAVLQDWIGSDLDRGRIVAAITNPGGAEPTPLAIFLLDRFSNDDQISSSLAATFSSGSWVGPWSARITAQIEQLTAWQDDTELPMGVRRWAKKMVDALRVEREAVLEREAERGY